MITEEIAVLTADIGDGKPSFSVGCKPKRISIRSFSENDTLSINVDSGTPYSSVAIQIEKGATE